MRFLFVFLALTGAVAVATGYFGVQFGHTDFWNHHSVLFLILIALFPRLTLLFSSVVSGGLFWWLSWIIAPRLLVAGLATLAYWDQNPILVVIAWLTAFGGESSEKYAVVRRSRAQWGSERGFESAKWVKAEETKSKRRKK